MVYATQNNVALCDMELSVLLESIFSFVYGK
jgi:hypothetical protein